MVPPKKKASAAPSAPEGQTRKTGGKKVPGPSARSAGMKASGAKKGTQNIRIRLSAFDHTVLDEAVTRIIDTAERSGAVVHGPIPLPTKIRKFTINRATFAKKDARDQFEMRTHRRLIDLTETTFRTIDALQSLSLPNGVEVEIKMKT